MRSAAIAILVLAVLGLWSVNHRLHGRQRLLEERLAAAEKKSRPKAAPPDTRAEVGMTSAPSSTSAAAAPVTDPPVQPPVLEEKITQLPNSANGRSVEAEAGTVEFDLRPTVLGQDAFLTGATFRLEESSDPWEALLDVEGLSDAQRAQIESLRRSHDAEAQPHKELIRGIEERYVDSARRVLTPEQQARGEEKKASLGVSRADYRKFLGKTGYEATLFWSLR